ncbi:hypothetical protein DL240_14520 [Lujinxingia litoralis]|uniref:Uncharacterized protein n=1 Tax=Lujinxingia litoralis TaxID=2211119 RepID=A0A328C4H1_9DELT|nr:hypothetical protein DL240_14520 [Lujinxingia litoralis]
MRGRPGGDARGGRALRSGAGAALPRRARHQRARLHGARRQRPGGHIPRHPGGARGPALGLRGRPHPGGGV